MFGGHSDTTKNSIWVGSKNRLYYWWYFCNAELIILKCIFCNVYFVSAHISVYRQYDDSDLREIPVSKYFETAENFDLQFYNCLDNSEQDFPQNPL